MLILLASPCLAKGPLYGPFYDSQKTNQEFQNVYNDIARPVIDAGKASTMTITNLYVSTETISGTLQFSDGSKITGWNPYSPTFQGCGTPTSVSAAYMQLGHMLYIYGQFIFGTTTASEMQIGLPSGYTTNSSIPINQNQPLGTANYVASTTTQYYMTAKPSVGYINIVAVDATHNLGTLLKGNDIFLTGNWFVFFGFVPI